MNKKMIVVLLVCLFVALGAVAALAISNTPFGTAITTVGPIQVPESASGVNIGRTSASPVGFYGTTPVTQISSANAAAVTQLTNTTMVTNSAAYGMSQTNMQLLVNDVTNLTTLVNELRREIVLLGLIKGQ